MKGRRSIAGGRAAACVVFILIGSGIDADRRQRQDVRNWFYSATGRGSISADLQRFAGGRMSVQWSAVDWQGAGLGLGKALLLYAGLSLIQWFFRRAPALRKSAMALNLGLLSLSILLFLSPYLDSIHSHFRKAVLAAFIFFCVCVLIRLMDSLVFGLISRLRQRKPVPVVLRDIGRWVVSLAALFMIVRLIFPGANLNVLALSSIVVGYIIGNATQDTLGNLIAGLALNTEQPFAIGDWVTAGGHTGVVVDMTWRATRLHTKSDDYIVIPNGMISKEPIVNYSRPSRRHARTVHVGASYEVPPKKVKSAILQALHEAPEVLRDPCPEAHIAAFGDSSINYAVKFYYLDFRREDDVESEVLDRIWYRFRREGISMPYPIRDVRMREITRADEEADRVAGLAEVGGRLRGIYLFDGLEADDLAFIAGHLREQIYAGGEVLVKQGEEGDSFYLVRDGRVVVCVRDEAGRETEVARLERDAFFGEMSLLTGEKRAATVKAETDTTVLVLAKDVFGAVLQRHGQLAEHLAEILERRSRERLEKMSITRDASADAAEMTSGVLLRRIRKFFGLEGKGLTQ